MSGRNSNTTKRLNGVSKSVPEKVAKTAVKVKKSEIVGKENNAVKKDKLVQNQPRTQSVPLNNNKAFKKDKVKKTIKSKQKILNGSLASSRTGKIFVGYHASSAGGVHNALVHTTEIGARCLALFLRPQRTWSAPPLSPEVVEKWHSLVSSHSLSPHLILPHGSYLINLGSPEESQRAKSVEVLVDELQRCQELGILLFNIHPGSSCGKISREESIRNIADGINTAHSRTPGSRVKVVLENMSCQGHTIGGDLRELRQIIDLIEDKTRVGVCLDTCHAMAAGYDLSCQVTFMILQTILWTRNIFEQVGFDRLLEDFNSMVGWEWLVGCHLNDSKGPAGCHRDRHEKIGKGCIGVDGFRRIVNCPHFTDIPLILETPLDEELGNQGYLQEIELLNSLIQ